MRLSLIVILLGLLSAWPAHALDSFADRMAKGQKAAWTILSSLEPADLHPELLPEAEFRDRVVKFYSEHFEELREEALKTTIEIVAVNANGACGQTAQTRFATISLSRQRCLDQIDSYGAAARLLIGEFVHHFGQGDEFTDWMKLVIVESYRKRYSQTAAEIFTRIDPYAPEVNFDLRKIYGALFVTPDTAVPEMFMVFDNNRGVAFDAPKKMANEVELIMITTKPVRWDAQRRVFITVGEWNITGYDQRHWGRGIYERYPVWFQRPFSIEFQVIQNGDGIRMSYDLPVRIELSRNDVVMQRVTKSYLRNPGKQVIDALFKQKRKAEDL